MTTIQLPTTTRRPPPTRSDYAQLSARIKQAGLLRRSPVYYGGLAVGMLATMVGLTWLSWHLGDSWWQLAVAAASAVVLAQAGFLGHEAAHRQVFASGKANDRAALILANLVVGLGIGWWRAKHTRHHKAPNAEGSDPDIAPGPIVYSVADRLRRGPIGRRVARHQGRYFFVLMALSALGMQVRSFSSLLAPRPVKRRRLELALLITRHVAVIGFAFWVMSPPVALAALAVQTCGLGWYLGLVFAPNHIGRPLVGREVQLDFVRRQVLMSRNLTGGRLADIGFGGLNHQIEHHLFPSMSRPNLRRAAPLVRAYCDEQGIVYHETSPWRAYREVADYIDRVGWDDVDLWQCPVAASLGRS